MIPPIQSANWHRLEETRFFPTHHLFYLEIRWACFLKDCFNEPSDLLLEECVQQYQERELRGSSRQWEILYQLNQKNKMLAENINHLASSSELYSSWIDILTDYHRIQSSVTRAEIDEDLLHSWEQSLDRFQVGFKSMAVSIRWEKLLQERVNELPTIHLLSLTKKVKWTLETRTLIHKSKAEFFQCIAIPSDVTYLRNRVHILEKQLLAPLDKTSYSLAILAETALNSWYFQRADFLIESQEKIATSRKWGCLSKPLSTFHLHLSKGITACSLLAQDFLEWQWSGLSQKLPHALVYQLHPTFNFCNRICLQLGKDERTTVRLLALLQPCMQICTFIALNKCLTAHSWSEIILSYGILSGVSMCSAKCVKTFYQTIYRDPETCPSYPLIKGLVGWLSFPLAARYLMPYFWDQWNMLFAKPANVLIDELACRAYPILCKKKACEILGLSETASPSAIQKAYRQLAKKFHPDQGGKSASFHSLTHAKELCLGLL